MWNLTLPHGAYALTLTWIMFLVVSNQMAFTSREGLTTRSTRTPLAPLHSSVACPLSTADISFRAIGMAWMTFTSRIRLDDVQTICLEKNTEKGSDPFRFFGWIRPLGLFDIHFSAIA